ATQANLEKTSGIIEVAETAQGLNRAAAQNFAASRLATYGVTAKTISFTTARVGLAVGQLLSVFLSQHQIVDEQLLISDIGIGWRMDTMRGTLDATPYFTVTCTNGYLSNSWATTLAQMGR